MRNFSIAASVPNFERAKLGFWWEKLESSAATGQEEISDWAAEWTRVSRSQSQSRVRNELGVALPVFLIFA